MTRPDRSRLDDPTAENTADNSTPAASGLSGGRTLGSETHEAEEEVVHRDGKQRSDTPRRYDQPAEEDPVMPADDSALNTKI